MPSPYLTAGEETWTRGLDLGGPFESCRTIRGMPAFRNLGTALLLLRTFTRKSQQQVAREVGCGKSQLSKYESGRELPKLDTLDRLLPALGTSSLSLFFLVSVLDGIEEPAPAGRWPHEPLLRSILPAFGQPDEAALGRLLTSLMRSFLDGQEERLAAEVRRLRGEAPLPPTDLG